MNVVMFALRLAFWDQEHERNELFGGPDAVKNADSKTKLTGSQFFGRFIFAMGLVTALFPVTLPMYALTGLFELYVQALDVAPSGAKVAYACLLAAPAASMSSAAPGKRRERTSRSPPASPPSRSSRRPRRWTERTRIIARRETR